MRLVIGKHRDHCISRIPRSSGPRLPSTKPQRRMLDYRRSKIRQITFQFQGIRDKSPCCLDNSPSGGARIEEVLPYTLAQRP
jgi:hypothetical protein